MMTGRFGSIGWQVSPFRFERTLILAPLALQVVPHSCALVYVRRTRLRVQYLSRPVVVHFHRWQGGHSSLSEVAHDVTTHTRPSSADTCVLALSTFTTTFSTLTSIMELESMVSTTEIASAVRPHTAQMSLLPSLTSPLTRPNAQASGVSIEALARLNYRLQFSSSVVTILSQTKRPRVSSNNGRRLGTIEPEHVNPRSCNGASNEAGRDC